MNNSRSISIDGMTLEIRGLYWGELDESAKAQVADAFTSLPDGVSLSDIKNLAPESKLETDVDKAVAKAEAKLAKYGGLHMGTLLRCGSVSLDGVVLLRCEKDHTHVAECIPEEIRRFSPRDADTVAQAIFEQTDMPQDEIENLGGG